MKNFADKVAVVTGAASGIGRALALRFAREGMRVVLADVERQALDEATAEVAKIAPAAIGAVTDVSKGADVEALAKKAVDAFGKVHVVCNNAGVAIPGLTWTTTVADWEWVLGVNLWGVIHGVRIFTPIMMAQNEEAHIVNTASMAGMFSGPGMSIYNVTKHGVVTLSETLHKELEAMGAKVKVSVLCPGFVNTRILDSQRNRPAHLAETAPPIPGSEEMDVAVRQLLASGSPPEYVAGEVFDAIRAERFYVFPHREFKDLIRKRMEEILEERNPSQPEMIINQAAR